MSTEIVKAAEQPKSPSMFEQIKLKAMQMAEAATKSKGVKAVALLLLSILTWHIGSAAHAMTAALYIFANDGKVSGRMQGDVKMRNGRQRAFTVPSLVRNAYTSAVRSRFQGFSSSYRGLTAPQIASWVNAVGFTYIDRFAQSHALKGKSLYIRLNSNIVNAGGTPITVAPLASGITPIEIAATVAISIAGVSMSITFFATPVPANTAVLVFGTTSLNSGIQRPGNSLFRQFDVLPPTTATPVNVWGAYVAKYGVPVLGSQVFIRLVTINMLTGEASAISQQVGVVGA